MSTDLTLEALIRQMRERLSPVCASDAQVSAEMDLLLAEVLNLTPAARFAGRATDLPAAQVARLEMLVNERISRRTPIQYLLGTADFYGLRLQVTPDVLIPRPETELLVEQSLEICREKLKTQPACRVLDLGTGSGAIAIALKHVLGEGVEVVAVDVSEAALLVASTNAREPGLSIDFRLGDGLACVTGESFDVIVSNPPYIGDGEKTEMEPDVLQHEPHLALFPSFQQRDRLYFYRLLAEQGRAIPEGNVLDLKGVVLMEMGQGMAMEAQQLFLSHGYCTVRILPDLSGQPRILVAHR